MSVSHIHVQSSLAIYKFRNEMLLFLYNVRVHVDPAGYFTVQN